MYSSTLSLTLRLTGVCGQRHAPAALPPGKTRYPLYRRLGGPKGRSRQVRKISPLTGFDPRNYCRNLSYLITHGSHNYFNNDKHAKIHFTCYLTSVCKSVTRSEEKRTCTCHDAEVQVKFSCFIKYQATTALE